MLYNTINTIYHLLGTVFLELWKRKNAGLAYKWDVDDFEQQVSRLVSNRNPMFVNIVGSCLHFDDPTIGKIVTQHNLPHGGVINV